MTNDEKKYPRKLKKELLSFFKGKSFEECVMELIYRFPNAESHIMSKLPKDIKEKIQNKLATINSI